MGQLKGPQAPKYKLINRLYLVKHLQGNKIFCHLTCVTFTGKASSRTVPTLQYNRSKVYNVTYKKVCTIKLYRLLSILILVFSSSSSFLRYITTLIRFFFYSSGTNTYSFIFFFSHFFFSFLGQYTSILPRLYVNPRVRYFSA